MNTFQCEKVFRQVITVWLICVLFAANWESETIITCSGIAASNCIILVNLLCIFVWIH